VLCAGAALLCFGAAPAYAFFRFAWEQGMTRYIRHAELELARRLDAHPLERLRRDVAGGKEPQVARPLPGGRVRAVAGGAAEPYSFLYAAPFYETAVADPAESRCVPESSPPSVMDVATEKLIPLLSDESIQLREVGRPAADDRLRVAGRTPEGGLCLKVLGLESGNQYLLRARPASFDLRLTTSTGLGLSAAALGLVALLVFLGRRFFLLDFKDPETLSLHALGDLPIRSNLFIVCPPMARKELVLARRDLLVVELGGRGLTESDLQALLREHPHPRALCFDRFEAALQEEGARPQLLQGLEAAIAMPGPPIVILSETEPETALGLDRPVSARDGSAEGDLRRRWAQALGRFARVLAVDPGDPAQFATDVARAEEQAVALASDPAEAERVRALFAVLRRECGSQHQLQVIGTTLLGLRDLSGYDPDRLVRHIRELADGFYRALWLALPDEEKLLLAQVAAGDLVNPRAGRALSRLLAQRLLVRNPSFRLVNESLARFVSGVVTRHDIAAWERSGTVSLWSEMRAPLLIGVLGVGGLLAYSEREIVPALVATVGAAVPVVSKLLDLLRTQKAPAGAR
jgi:hypothetical protein